MRPTRNQRGAVTAEVAIALPVLLSLLFIGIWSIGVVIVNIRCIDAARDVARAAARGESLEGAQAIGRRTAPSNATIDIERAGLDIHVTVTTHAKAPLLAALPAAPVTAEATLQSEPGTQGDTP